MSLRSRLARNKRGVASATVVSLVVGTVVALSLNYEGVATADVDLNDGGVWVSSNSHILVGRLNYPVGEIDASVAATSPNSDLLQREEVVFVRDRAANTLQRIDTSAVAAGGSPVQLPPGSDVELGKDTLGVLVEETGEFRVLGLDQLAVLEDATEDPQAVLGEGAAQAVADDGTAFGLDTLTGSLLTITPAQRAEAEEGLEPTTTVLDDAELLTDADVQMTAVGTSPVVLSYQEDGTDGESLAILQPDRGTIDLSDLDIDLATARLQTPSASGRTVAFATSDALVTVPLTGGDPHVMAVEEPGEPAAPMQVRGCTHGAWSSASPTYLRTCDDGDPVSLPVPEGTGGELTFRTNRGYVVLNELSTGNSWMIEDTLILVDNWEDVTPPEAEEEDDEESSEQVQQEVPLDREAENRPPVANPDQFGVRAGRTVVLPVLDNDTDPDGDLLSVAAFEGVPGSFGTVQSILGGRALQVAVAPDATGSATLTYTADDGRTGTDTATAEIRVSPMGSNGAPEQTKEITARVVSGETVQVNLLNDVRDPDGDSLYVAGKSPHDMFTVVASPNGTISITDLGLASGKQEVVVQVSDGQAVSDVTIEVEVLPRAAQPPQAVFDYATAFVDQTVTVSPLENDLDPNDMPLRLSNVTTSGGGTIVTNYEQGTFTFTAPTAGDHYLEYVVADDDGLTSTGLVRVHVTAKQDAAPPVAVSDTALLPPGGSVLVDVLANDTDPSGGVLAVQRIDVPQGLGLNVAILDHKILRITSDRLVVAPVTIGYTVSNGTSVADGQVLVLPMADGEAAQPPVGVPDVARVRAGDHVTVPVLANDSHPNGLDFELVPELDEEPAAGLMFVAGDVVRFEAPDEAQTIQAVYSLVDENGQSDSASITIYVQARSDDANAPPVPENVETRAFGGERIRIPIMTYGIDPDGDSVQLLGVDTAPELGRIMEVGPAYLDYQAYTAETGPDEFTYSVRDRLGAVATASVVVGVIEPPLSNRDPVAVADAVTVRPDRAVQVDVLVNDTDPDGDQLALDDPAFGSTGGVDDVHVDGGGVAFTSPSEAGTYIVEYHVTDRHGGSDTGSLTITVDPDGAPQPPVAVDDVVPGSAILDKESVDVVVLENDYDPDGSRESLTVSVPGSSSETAQVVGGNLRVELTERRQVVTYMITDEDGLSSYAFVDVPGLTDTGPVLRPDAEPIVVESGVRTEIALEEYVVSLSGAPVQLSDTSMVRATNSDGSNPVVDSTTLQYTSAEGYDGAATLTFEVTDAPDINADGILTSVLTLPITVNSDQDLPPEFRGGELDAEVGGDEVTLDLSRLAQDDLLQPGELDYEVAAQADGFRAELTDDVILRVTADNDTAVGQTSVLQVTVADGQNDPVTGEITLTATRSNRPLIVANNDDAGEVHQGESVTVPVLANDSNPFEGEPRTVTNAEVTQGAGTATVSGDQVTITPAGDFVGRMTAVYTVVDVTGDASRQVQAQITAAVLGVPETPAVPYVESVGNRQVVLSWSPPIDNGSPITGYTVNAGGVSQQCGTTTCLITGLTNGTTYNFTVTATNAVGDSPPSAASADARPDVKPAAPAPPTVAYGDGELTVSWNTPVNEGTPITSYDVQISPSVGTSQQSVTGTSMTWTGLTNGQTYTFRVRAINDAPDPGDWSGWSQPEYPSGVPFQPAAPTVNRIDDPAGGQLRVAWTAPNDNGDSIDAYHLTMYQDGTAISTMRESGAATSRVVQVENAHDYHFTVVAENRSGRSQTSPTSPSVRSFGAPGQVTGVSAAPTGEDQRATVTYTAPPNNGQAISAYQYSVSGGGAQSLSSSRVVTVPQDGAAYSVRVRACNTYCGPWSAASNSFSTYGPPGVSTVSITSSADLQKVTFSWSAGASDNGANITATRYSIDGGGWRTVDGRVGTASTSGGWEQNHTIRVQVRNQHGQWSDPATATRSQRAEADPTPPAPPRVWVTQGRQYPCQIGGNNCRTFQLNWENIPSSGQGTHNVTIRVTDGGVCGGPFTPQGNPYPEQINSANGSTEIGHSGYMPPHLGPTCGGTVQLTISPHGSWAQNTPW